MGFRVSRVQIPPSRLSEDQALQRLSLWGFGKDGDPLNSAQEVARCESCCDSATILGRSSGRFMFARVVPDVAARVARPRAAVGPSPGSATTLRRSRNPAPDEVE